MVYRYLNNHRSESSSLGLLFLRFFLESLSPAAASCFLFSSYCLICSKISAYSADI